MRVLGNLHIDVAVATSLTPPGAGQAPFCTGKQLFHRAALRRRRTLGRDSPSGLSSRSPRL